MTSHRRYLDLAAASIDFPLTIDESREFAAHLVACEACRDAAAEMRADADRLAALPGPPPPAAVRSVVLAAAARPARRPFPRAIAALAAALAVLLVALASAPVGSFLRGVRDDHGTGPERLSWSRLPGPAAGGVGYDRGEITALVVDRGRLVAAGIGAGGGRIWFSDDGDRWESTGEAGVFDRGRVLALAVADGASGEAIVGVGSVVTPGGEPNGAIWWSPDRVSWTRVDLVEARSLTAVLAAPGILIAAGAADDPRGAPIWTSTDGLTWSRAAESPGFSRSVVSALGVGRDGFIALGQDDRGAVAWTSLDGIAWDRVPAPSGFELRRINAVASTGRGFAAVGNDAAGPAAWWSADGLGWARAGVGGVAPAGRMTAITVIDGDFVAVGSGQDGALAWASPDGHAWRLLPDDPALGSAEALAVAVHDGAVLAAGRLEGEPAIWRGIGPE